MMIKNNFQIFDSRLLYSIYIHKTWFSDTHAYTLYAHTHKSF